MGNTPNNNSRSQYPQPSPQSQQSQQQRPQSLSSAGTSGGGGDVRCPSCSKVLRPPPGAPRFRCPCGKVLGAPPPSAYTPLPSQNRSIPPQQQQTQSSQQPLQSQNRSVPPARPTQQQQQQQQQQQHAPAILTRVRCPRCQQVLIPPAGAPQFACPCGQVLRSPAAVAPPPTPTPPPRTASNASPSQQQRAAPPPPPAAQAAPPRRVRCPNCSRVLQCPPGARVFRCQCGVHLTAPGQQAPPAAPPPPSTATTAAAAANTVMPPLSVNSNASMEATTIDVLQSNDDVGSWRRRMLGPNDNRLAWAQVYSESDEANILEAEQLVMDSLTLSGLEGLSNTELKRRLVRFEELGLVDLRACLEREDLIKVALDLIQDLPTRSDAMLKSKLIQLQVECSKCVDQTDLANRLFAFLWTDGKSIQDSIRINKGHVRSITQTGSLVWSTGEEFFIPMGTPERAREVLAMSTNPSFSNKLAWFRKECQNMLIPWDSGHVKVVVKRESILEDAFNAIYNLPASDLHKYFRYEFLGEPGLDAGGIAREWFSLVSEQVFNVDLILFEYSQAGNLTYQISANSELANSGHLAWFKFIGRLLGRALFEGQQIGPHLTRILYKHMLAWPITESDLEFVDTEVKKSVDQMREMDPDSIADLCMDFTTTKSVFGENIIVELLPGGADIEVTGENLNQFLEARLKYYCMNQVQSQLHALLMGFYEVVPLQLLSVFNFFEVELLMCGLPKISVSDWKQHTQYRGAFAEQMALHPVVKMFWEVMEESNEEERAKFLQFATGTSRVPVQGFSALQGNDGNIKLFTLDSLELTVSVFPKAHTCFNRIDLPLYQNKDEMKFRMAQALQLEGVGFQIE